MKLLPTLLAVSLALGGMSGTYTIKPDGSGDFRTIYEAGTTLSDSGLSGDCVFEVYGDTLDASLILSDVAGSGTWTTTFRPGPGEHPVLAGGVMGVFGTHRLKVEDLDLFDVGANMRGCDGFRISGCRLTSVHVGLVMEDGNFDSIVRNVLVTDEGAEDVISAVACRGLIVANNFISGTVSGSRSEGLVTINGGGQNMVCFNTLRSMPLQVASGAALLFDDLENGRADVRNNLVILAPPAESNNACIGYYAVTAESLGADYNCYFVESLGYIGLTASGGPAPLFHDWTAWRALGHDPHGLNADPLVFGPENLHLREGSPCIGAGVPIVGITTDIDGDPRDPAHPDIGADEFTGGGVEEHPTPDASRITPGMTIVRNVLYLTPSPFPLPSGEGQEVRGRSELLEITGRKVMDLVPGPNDVRHLSPGVYFVRAASNDGRMVNSKIVVTR